MSEKEQRRKARKQKKASHQGSPRLKPLSDRQEDRIMRHHTDVLQNIEFIVHDSWRLDPAIDDNTVAIALNAALDMPGPTDEHSELIASRLRQIRLDRPDTAEDTWRDALQVVANSIRRHSTLMPRDRGYLTFISTFFP